MDERIIHAYIFNNKHVRVRDIERRMGVSRNTIAKKRKISMKHLPVIVAILKKYYGYRGGAKKGDVIIPEAVLGDGRVFELRREVIIKRKKQPLIGVRLYERIGGVWYHSHALSGKRFRGEIIE